jgi:nucleoside-diphosphate-sugar epimerase
VNGEVFNTGGDDGNYTKRMIIEAALEAIDNPGEVVWTEGGDDARNYRVSFAKIRDALGFEPAISVPSAIERLVAAVRGGLFPEVETRPLYYRNFALQAPAGEGSGGGDAG